MSAEEGRIGWMGELAAMQEVPDVRQRALAARIVMVATMLMMTAMVVFVGLKMTAPLPIAIKAFWFALSLAVLYIVLRIRRWDAHYRPIDDFLEAAVEDLWLLESPVPVRQTIRHWRSQRAAGRLLLCDAERMMDFFDRHPEVDPRDAERNGDDWAGG